MPVPGHRRVGDWGSDTQDTQDSDHVGGVWLQKLSKVGHLSLCKKVFNLYRMFSEGLISILFF